VSRQGRRSLRLETADECCASAASSVLGEIGHFLQSRAGPQAEVTCGPRTLGARVVIVGRCALA